MRGGSEEEEEERERDPFAIDERRPFELPVGAVQCADLAAPADQDPGALEVADQVVRHRLAEVVPAVEKRHESAPAGEPDGRLGGRVPADKITPVIDRTYSLSETPDAIRYLDEGHTRGKVVITVSGRGDALASSG